MVKAKDILGLNGRSLLYVKKYNKAKDLHFADSKLKAKRFLEARGIRAAKLVRVFKHHNEVTLESIKSLPSNIVIKPNDSSGGSGILVLKTKQPYGWIRSSGAKITHEEVYRHCNNIIAGAYHGLGMNDIVLIEKRIITHPKLKPISYKGLPDIRVVVFNMVPVLAMLRLPTPESGGTANLHAGGIAAGIDISKGEITYLSRYHKLINELPGYGEIRGLKIPFWDQILRMSSKIQQVTKLGYVGVDIALDKHGPVLLEVNARAGLEIQVANLVPLRKRLKRIEGLKVKTVTQGINLAKSMFGRKVERDIESLSGKAVLGDREYIYLHLPNGPKQYLVKINPMLNENYMSTELFDELKATSPKDAISEDSLKLRYTLMSRKSHTIFKPMTMPHPESHIILGKRELSHFLIDPYKYKEGELPAQMKDMEELQAIQAKVSLKENQRSWKKIDEKLYEIDSKLTKAFSLMPTNYLDEQEQFIRRDGEYNPQFEYKRNDDVYEESMGELDRLNIDQQSPLGVFFEKKRRELIQKAQMFYHIGIDAPAFTRFSHEVFQTDYDFLEEAKIFVRDYTKLKDVPNKRTIIGAQGAIQLLEEHLKDIHLQNWHIVERTKGAARIGVGTSKKRNIYIRRDATFYKESFQSLLAHEVDTHAIRMENALQQTYNILSRGPYYLETEEGLAIYNQMQFLTKQQQKYYLPALNYIKTTRMHEHAFADGAKTSIMELLRRDVSSRETYLLKVFRSIFRAKKGIGDTSQGGGYTKDLAYYRGYLKVKSYVAGGGSLANLYIGKVHLDDMEMLSTIDSVKAPRYLPNFIHD